MLIDGKRVVSINAEAKCSPVISMGASLDFYRDLINGELDSAKDYPLVPAGPVGMTKGPMRYWAVMVDGSERDLDRETFDLMTRERHRQNCLELREETRREAEGGELPGDRMFDALIAECDAGITKQPLPRKRDEKA